MKPSKYHPETLVVTLQDDPNQPPAYAVGSPLQATVTIADNEEMPVVILTASGSPSETSPGSPATITFHRTGSVAQELIVYFHLPVEPGDALLGADYTLDPPMTGEINFGVNESSKTIQLFPLQDSRTEGPEPVTVQILPNPSYQLGTPYDTTLTIQDNDNVSLLFNYSITSLGPVNKLSHASGINNLGRVTGDYLYVSPIWWRGFSWYNGSLTTIGVITAYNCGQKHVCAVSHGVAINDNRVVAGYGGFADGEGDPQDIPFRWTSGAPVALGRLDSNQEYGNRAVAINNDGHIVGFSKNSLGKTRAVLWNVGTTTAFDLRTLSGLDTTKESSAAGIGVSRKIVGRSEIATYNGTIHAFRTQPLATIVQADDLGNLVGVESMNSEANWINDFDEVAGATTVAGGQYHAFWKDGYSGKNQGFIDLGVLPGDDRSVALGLSNYGHAVGYSLNTSTGNQRAVVWFSNGVMWDLTAQVGAANGWVLKSANSINNDGWIVGWGVKGGIERGFLLVPNAY